jgi:3-deoxy-D-manno-octulosonic-acid transferase
MKAARRLPFGLRAYRALTGALAWAAPALLAARARRGKEEPARLDERLGRAPAPPRTGGPLAWLHAASVGESVLALALAGEMRAARPDLRFLFTSGTVTSARLVGERLSPGDVHRYVPVDTPGATRAFIDAWRPDLGVFIESEIWPNLLLAAHGAGVPLALVNARMNARSARGWSRRMASARALFNLFDIVLPADAFTAQALAALRDGPTGPPGNLKLAAAPAPVDAARLAEVKAATGDRPVWLAASTHAGEDGLMLEAHAALRMAAPDALLILAPRHPERGEDVAVDCRRAGFVPARRSRGEAPSPAEAVWLWDTLGELDLAAHAARVACVAGSFLPGGGGHNPVEPALAGAAVVSGPHVASFSDLYRDLADAGGAILLAEADARALAMIVAGLLGDEAWRAAQCAAAREVVARGRASMARTLAALTPMLPPGPPREAAS